MKQNDSSSISGNALSGVASVHNPSFPCTCFIEQNGQAVKINYCHMHEAAPKLLSAARLAVETLSKANTQNQWKDFSDNDRVNIAHSFNCVEKLNAAILAAGR